MGLQVHSQLLFLSERGIQVNGNMNVFCAKAVENDPQFSPHTVDVCCVHCTKGLKVTSIEKQFLAIVNAVDSCTPVSHLQIKSIQIHLFEEKIAITNILKQLAFCKSMHNSINTKIQFDSTVTWNKTLLSGIREMSARNSTINHYQNLTPPKSQQFLLKHFNDL